MTQKIWFITGSSRGLGHSIAIAALKNGDKVVATARDLKTLDGLVKKFGKKVLPLKLDVTDRKQVHETIKSSIYYFGRIDVLVNNAGYANISSIEEIDYDDLRDQIETDLFGTINVTK